MSYSDFEYTIVLYALNTCSVYSPIPALDNKFFFIVAQGVDFLYTPGKKVAVFVLL
jgi:hypothetical protein